MLRGTVKLVWKNRPTQHHATTEYVTLNGIHIKSDCILEFTEAKSGVLYGIPLVNLWSYEVHWISA